MRFVRMNLSQPPKSFWLNWGGVQRSLEEWTQPPDKWKLILFGHSGVARANGRLYQYSEKTGMIFPPNAICGLSTWGEQFPIVGADFDLDPEATQPHALPVEFEQKNDWYEDLFDAGERATIGAFRAKAIIWHILWSIAKPPSTLRDQSVLYDAEDYIRSHLHESIRIPDLAELLGVSQSSLLGWFQAEHGTTVQGFIRQTRAREACRLLSGSHMRIKEIALKVGVPDLHQFNKLVRTHSGLSPREYRAKST